MEKILWNEVTWYSKTLTLIIFITLPFVGFYFGTQYGLLEEFVTMKQKTIASVIGTPATNYYNNPAEWQTDANNTKGGFSIAYPIDFDVQDNYTNAPSQNWRVGATTDGIVYFTLTVPRVFEPQTNFADVTLTVGSSGDAAAVAQCLSPDQSGGPAAATSTATVNGIVFTVFHSNDAGAGNYYQTTSYRTLHAGQCYAVEYTIHSGQIANYPTSYNLQPFDQAKIDTLMQTIIGTFKFI